MPQQHEPNKGQKGRKMRDHKKRSRQNNHQGDRQNQRRDQEQQKG